MKKPAKTKKAGGLPGKATPGRTEMAPTKEREAAPGLPAREPLPAAAPKPAKKGMRKS